MRTKVQQTSQKSSIKMFKLHYATGTVRRYFVSLEKCIHFINRVFWEQNHEPEFITLPNGTQIPYNSTFAHYFAAKGRITEEQFIEYSTQKN